jgi:pimeloyl-ACP methyl ester carboxylesterase
MSWTDPIRTLATAALAGVFALTSQAAVSAAPVDTWKGNGILRGGRGYVTTPMGQVHYRDIGPRDDKYPLVLLHMTPMSMVEFAEAQDELAKLGHRSIAVDTPGYGFSDAPLDNPEPTIEQFAANLLAVLDQLHLKKVIVVGHHTGATIAASFVADHPDRVAAVVLHGVPIFTPDEIKMRVDRGPIRRPVAADGSHLSKFFHAPAPDAKPYHPKYLDSQTWFNVLMFEMGPDIGHPAVYSHDMSADFMRIKVPGMIVSDRKDETHVADMRSAKMRPDFEYRDFSDEGILSIMEEPKAWAKLIADFADAIERR